MHSLTQRQRKYQAQCSKHCLHWLVVSSASYLCASHGIFPLFLHSHVQVTLLLPVIHHTQMFPEIQPCFRTVNQKEETKKGASHWVIKPLCTSVCRQVSNLLANKAARRRLLHQRPLCEHFDPVTASYHSPTARRTAIFQGR